MMKLAPTNEETFNIQHYYFLRIGMINSESTGDFIENIKPDFNLAVASDENESLIIHNQSFGTLIFKNQSFSEVINDVVSKLPSLIDPSILSGLYISLFEEDADGLINVSEAFEDKIYEANEVDDVGEHVNSIFGVSSISRNTGAKVDISNGHVEHDGGTLDDISSFYGNVDEENTRVIGLSLG